MDGNCHFVYGAALGTAVAINLDRITEYLPSITNTPETITLFVLGGLLGGIFPDIDNPKSYMGKLSVPVSKIIGKISSFFGKTGKFHRGVLHDPTVYIAGLVLSYFFFSPMAGFFVGCLSHIFLDMFNPMGVPFMFGRTLRLAKIPSGSKQSVMFTWINVFIVTVIGIILKLKIFI